MKLYGFQRSRSFRIIWMFKELDVDFEYVQINPKEDLHSDWFLSINPAAKVPVLIDEELTLTESAAILTYLGDKYPHSQLVPPCGSKQRAIYNQWCFYALSELEQPLWQLHKHRFILPKNLRIKEIKRSLLWEFEKQLIVLSLGLGTQDWIMGKTFSAADILIGDTLGWSKNSKIDLPHPNLERYHQRLMNRPAYHLSQVEYH